MLIRLECPRLRGLMSKRLCTLSERGKKDVVEKLTACSSEVETLKTRLQIVLFGRSDLECKLGRSRAKVAELEDMKIMIAELMSKIGGCTARLAALEKEHSVDVGRLVEFGFGRF